MCYVYVDPTESVCAVAALVCPVCVVRGATSGSTSAVCELRAKWRRVCAGGARSSGDSTNMIYAVIMTYLVSFFM